MKVGMSLIALAAVLLAWSVPVNAADQAQPPSTLTDAEKQSGWRLLFDGQTTDGWRGYQMTTLPPGWKAREGALVRVSGGAGGKGAGGGDDIVTLEEFENFDLRLEWKLVPKGNSGVLYHVSEEPVTAWHYAPEVQILDNPAYPKNDPPKLTGACYDLYAPSKDVTKPPGQWNQMRILDTLRDFVGGRGCVVRHGYMVYSWGDVSRRADVASACKPWFSHFLFKAMEDGKLESLDEKVVRWEPRLGNINQGLGHKDREITWRHLANQASCYQLLDKPGTAFAYNDWQMALFWDTLFLKVYGSTYDNVDDQVLHPRLTEPLQCEDNPS